ncbi:MAG: tRNA (guanosine(46)-N7)-methyltransferase TrmB [Clostridia bacterium]|nr:tRNA (guanosine(46)-N7)-methyltransferase TrmB [Clostridia bacterium]
MRMRKKRNGVGRLEAAGDLIVKDRASLPPTPVTIEIGCGKGGFICEAAKREPDKQFVAVEICLDVAVLAAERVEREGINNVHFIVADAKTLPDYFDKGDVDRIYLNFSDPWPNSGQHKRRLTYRSFLTVYKSILKDGGSVIFKTDNEKLFDFSLEEFTFCGFELRGVTRDLHGSEYNEGNIMTEYERNFSSRGFKINRVEAVLPESAGFTLRLASADELDGPVPAMFDDARAYMKKNGIDQWQDGYPTPEILREDVEKGRAYVLETSGKPVAYAVLCFGEEPTYREISGSWPDDLPYAAIHRIVVAKEHKGMDLARKMFNGFETVCRGKGINEIRCDTHADNRSMRRALEKNGFTECGTIRLENGAPRVAYCKHI